MKKKLPVIKTSAVSSPSLENMQLNASIPLTGLAGAIKDGLLAFSAAAGLAVMQEMMTQELTEQIGPKHAKQAGRSGNWHGTTQGSVVLGGRKLTVERPRGRCVAGGEIELETWNTFSSEDLFRSLVVERMLAGVATRRHADVSESLGEELDGESRATGKSSVSRRFVAATEEALTELMARDLSDIDVAALMIDGFNLADQMMTVAMIIDVEGNKTPVGLYLGDTENSTVVSALLADLGARGLHFEQGVLCVIDGAKALASGIKKVFGDRAVIQRCVIHKRRNVKGHLPDELGRSVDKRLGKIFANPDTKAGIASAKALANQLKVDHPDAAASLLEGLEDMFATTRLGCSTALAKTLNNTNCIESMISVTRRVMRNVKRWQDGTMKKRWCAAGLLEAQRSFRRIRGYKDMPTFVQRLRQHISLNADSVTPTNYNESHDQAVA
jgi:putative transposase